MPAKIQSDSLPTQSWKPGSRRYRSGFCNDLDGDSLRTLPQHEIDGSGADDDEDDAGKHYAPDDAIDHALSFQIHCASRTATSIRIEQVTTITTGFLVHLSIRWRMALVSPSIPFQLLPYRA